MEKISDYNQLVQYLKDNSNAEFNEFNSKIVNSGVETIGCTVPFMRKLAKSLDLDFALSLPVNKYMEVDLLRGIVISNAKLPFDVKSKLLFDFAGTIENWAVCDCSTVKPVLKGREIYFNYFCSLWGEYYVDMAVAWLVATAMVKCRDKTVEYMQAEGRRILSKFAYNKALQKMRESLRVSKEDKQWTYTMKID